MPEPLVLLQRLRDGFWWRPNRQGYTDDIADAGLYTESEARAITRAADDHSVIVRAEEAAMLISNHIDRLAERERKLIRLRQELWSGGV